MSSAGLATAAAVGGGGGEEFSLPMRSIPDKAFVGVVKGRPLLRLLDQMELLNGVVDHRPLGLPRIDCSKDKSPVSSCQVTSVVTTFYLFLQPPSKTKVSKKKEACCGSPSTFTATCCFEIALGKQKRNHTTNVCPVTDGPKSATTSQVLRCFHLSLYVPIPY